MNWTFTTIEPLVPQSRLAIGQFTAIAADFGCARIANLHREARSVWAP